MTIHLGLIGSGNISETHARAAAEIEDVALAGVFGRNATAAAALAARHGTSPFRTIDDLLSRRPLDAVIVGTPSGVHADAVHAAAAHRVHVLVEKPLEISTARIDRMVAACAQAGVTLGVIFQDRTAPDLVWLARRIQRGELGTPLLASASVRWYRPPEYYAGSSWRGTHALDGGGALMNQGIHTVDLLLWLFGPVMRVSAVTKTALHAIDVEDMVVATLEFSNGAVGTLEVTTAAYPGLPRRLELTGTEGTVIVEADRVTRVALRTTPDEPLPQHAGNANASASSPVVSDVQGHRRVLDDFVCALRDGRAPMCDAREARRSVELIEAIYQSAATHAPVALPGAI